MVAAILALVTAILAAIPAILNLLEGRKASRNALQQALRQRSLDELDAGVASLRPKPPAL